MRLDKLEIELRPRTHVQALDLGFALLRAHASSTYKTWLALWLPAMILCAVLTVFFPTLLWLWVFVAWWLRPMFERAPLYVLSRHVFGEAVTWQAALRAWPGQLGGGWIRMLTWYRPFAAARGLYQPIWQLEMARGKVAADRRILIGARGTTGAAFWFGVVCAHFEVVLQVGLIAFIGIFFSDAEGVNPFNFLFGPNRGVGLALTNSLLLGGYAISGAIMGPIYTACCFTLYLNRRARLEAWDIEIVLRQLAPPVAKASQRRGGALALMLLAPLLAIDLYGAPGAHAAELANGHCKVPAQILKRGTVRGPDHDDAQRALRSEVARIYGSDDLRGYQCEYSWYPKRSKPEHEKKATTLPDLSALADVLKVVLVASALLLVGWLLYRYRGHFPAVEWGRRARPATEIGGMDIRPESLPDDVGAAVRALWAAGEQRAALALLYRATLSRLVNTDGLPLRTGDTEGDCLRIALRARQSQRISESRHALMHATTTLWLNAAYAGRWPDTAAVRAHSAAWQAEFGASDQAAPA
jgi:hypothetical protein